MDWHYEKDGSSAGPVSEAQLHAMRASGEISSTTRVWKSGWTDWQQAADVWPDDQIARSNGPVASCAECNRFYPASELMRIDNVEVCPACKPTVIDKLRQGVTLGAGPWQDGKQMVVMKDTPLPDKCFKCAAPPVKTVKKTLSWHHPLVYIAILPGLLVYVLIALCVRKTTKVGIPLCRDCNRARNRKLTLAWTGAVIGFGLLCAGIAAGATDPSMTGVLAISGATLLLACLLWAALASTVAAKKIDKTHAWLAKAGRPVLDSLPQWRGQG
ncbi:DUF4339 domain-containing protein [Verrucomicrobium sp. BvORR034]|uniref:DUF4339 domain-containing protein n=1 Tax=Verrucomicrobium sp. BvORR034 TaxID=1396418 RepID=UPI000679AC57|nr:DUF4339 domain-containing protein [Verrucomicrobium sp. BvORR034]